MKTIQITYDFTMNQPGREDQTFQRKLFVDLTEFVDSDYLEDVDLSDKDEIQNAFNSFLDDQVEADGDSNDVACPYSLDHTSIWDTHYETIMSAVTEV